MRRTHPRPDQFSTSTSKGGGSTLFLSVLPTKGEGMRRTVVLVSSMAFAVLLSCGVALALNAIACEGGGERCVGTDRPDLMKGTGDIDAIYGRDKGDPLKGFGDTDALLGQKGEDTLIGGPGRDFLIGGPDD